MARALINVPAKARRGEIIEIKTLISHIMETGYRHMAQASRSARHHHALSCRYNGDRDFPRRSVSGDRRQPVHRVLHHGDRKRDTRVRMDRRQRVLRNRVRPITVE